MIRVLDTSNGKFVELKDSDPFEYAILSHTWDPAGEQTYQDVRRIQDSSLAKALSLFVWLWWRFIPLLLAICDGLHLPTIVTRMDIIAYNVFDAVRTSLRLKIYLQDQMLYKLCTHAKLHCTTVA